MIRNLNKCFPNASGTKTYEGAEKRLNKALKHLGDDHAIITAVVRREDNTFIAVAVLGDSSSYLAGALAHNNVCVTVIG